VRSRVGQQLRAGNLKYAHFIFCEGGWKYVNKKEKIRLLAIIDEFDKRLKPCA
jgi:hypothetical protein